MTDIAIPRRGLDPVDKVFLGTTLGLTALSIMAFAPPNPALRVVAPALDLTLDTIAMVVTMTVAGLAWIRFRERHDAFAVYQAAAFLAIALGNLGGVVGTIVTHGDSTLSTVEPGPEHLHIFAWARLLGGALIVAGGVASLRGRSPAHPRTLVLVVGLAVLALIFLVEANAPLPALVDGPTGDQVAPRMTPFGVGLHLLGAVLYGIGAWLTRLLWRRDGSIGDRYIAFGLILAAFAQLHAAVFPGTHPGPVTSADVLRLGFDIVLLLAIEAEASAIMRALRGANVALEAMRAAEVDRAAIDERTRLSRELHDGLAQALWLAKLKLARLTAESHLSADAQALAREATEAVELGLSEARQAVLAIRISADTSPHFGPLLSRYLEDHADRFGLRVEFDCRPDLPALPARTQAELLRIAQEALANVRRHAGASSVTVRVEHYRGEVLLTVADDGIGFDPASVADAGFGLSAMRERAALVGGRLTINSVPGHGTEILVVAPIGGAANPASPVGGRA
ncbi:MAG: sensor histidine kinase [Chloroflexota bacterium]|nr:MAG: sensor histidine kinase [Chloroflexota bacterium]